MWVSVPFWYACFVKRGFLAWSLIYFNIGIKKVAENNFCQVKFKIFKTIMIVIYNPYHKEVAKQEIIF